MDDLTTQILTDIRDEARKTGARLDQTNSRIQQTNDRLERLEHRQMEGELRIATEIVAVAGAVRDLKEALIEDRRLSARVESHELRITALEQSVAR